MHLAQVQTEIGDDVEVLDSISFKKLDKSRSAHLVVRIEALWTKTFDVLAKPYQDSPVDAN